MAVPPGALAKCCVLKNDPTTRFPERALLRVLMVRHPQPEELHIVVVIQENVAR